MNIQKILTDLKVDAKNELNNIKNSNYLFSDSKFKRATVLKLAIETINFTLASFHESEYDKFQELFLNEVKRTIKRKMVFNLDKAELIELEAELEVYKVIVFELAKTNESFEFIESLLR